MATVRSWALTKAGAALEPYQFEAGELGAEDVEVEVEYCGLCHSDLSVLQGEWGPPRVPVVAGHEAIGRVVALGSHAKGLTLGQRVGVGWMASSCLHCRECLRGDHHMCSRGGATILGRHGGFAERVRVHWCWAIPIPDALDPGMVGPLLCGGITVFSPLLTSGVRPTGRIGVVGIGGLGHMALKFARAWGCEVTAFTSTAAKNADAKALGAHHVVPSNDSKAIAMAAGSIDLLIVTANQPLDWSALIKTLRVHGEMCVVGAVLEPMPIRVTDLMGRHKKVSSSPTGSPAEIAAMLEFAARHGIAAQVERFPMSRVNDALAHLQQGKARYRVVLEADFGKA